MRGEPQPQHRQQDRGDHEDRGPARAVDQQRAARDAERLADVERGRKQRHGGAARLRRHLRGVDLQRVVQHVESKPDRDHGCRRDPPRRRERERQIGDADQQPAECRKTGLAEMADEAMDAAGVDQSSDAERADNQSDERERQRETQMQIGADIGECAPHQRRLEDRREQHDARPAVGEHRGIVCDEAARALICRLLRPRGRIVRKLAKESNSGERECAASRKNTARQPSQSPMTPPAAWPNSCPVICPVR